MITIAKRMQLLMLSISGDVFVGDSVSAMGMRRVTEVIPPDMCSPLPWGLS